MKQDSSESKIRVGILGASGYMGGELLRILLRHPRVTILWATSRHGEEMSHYHPNIIDSDLELISPDKITPCDMVFMALPTEQSMDFIKTISTWDCRVIDLGATFRLSDRELWESIYQMRHESWSNAQSAVYGISELHYERIKTARLIANPGCFSSAAILALAPLMQYDYIDKTKISVTGLSGTAGIGSELTNFAHHPEMSNNLVPYNVTLHRHSAEIEQELRLLCNEPVSVHFTPVYVPISRGILNICSVFTSQTVNRNFLLDLYDDFYSEHPFVSTIRHEKEEDVNWQYRPYPWVSAIRGSNRCLLGIDYDAERNRIVLFSALDSLGKGGAQVGIENMNIMMGYDRQTGLDQISVYP